MMSLCMNEDKRFAMVEIETSGFYRRTSSEKELSVWLNHASHELGFTLHVMRVMCEMPRGREQSQDQQEERLEETDFLWE